MCVGKRERQRKRKRDRQTERERELIVDEEFFLFIEATNEQQKILRLEFLSFVVSTAAMSR